MCSPDLYWIVQPAGFAGVAGFGLGCDLCLVPALFFVVVCAWRVFRVCCNISSCAPVCDACMAPCDVQLKWPPGDIGMLLHNAFATQKLRQ